MSVALTPLLSSQHALAAWLLTQSDTPQLRIKSASVCERGHRLRAYYDAYHLRLVEVMGNDFPLVRLQLGDESMEALVRDYLRAHPSTHPSVRFLGRQFAPWLRKRGGERSLLAELAQFEWAQGEVFDATDLRVCTLENLMAIEPQAWPQLRVQFHPGMRVMLLRSNAAQLAEADANDTPMPLLDESEPATWVLWRQHYDVHWRRMPEDEHRMMVALHEGKPLEIATACLEEQGEPALRMAGLLKRWLTDHLIVGLEAAT